MIRTLFSAIADLLATFIDLGISSSAIDECKEIAEKPFVCPNCGKEFYKKWGQLYFNGFTPKLTNKAILKCPHCKERDACRWTGVDRVGNYQ
jgi:RNA polymerase subunit RPABC4/transcription elongation factor Spt4